MKILYLILAKIYEAHHRAFTIAKITKIDLLNDIKDSLEQSFKNGINFKQWKQDITPTLQDYGWIGKTEVINPSNGIPRDIYVGSRRLKNIFNTNMRVAYSKANYESGMQAKGGYFRYVALLDSKTRNSHKAMHGIILPKTHPFWDKNYPPNDWGCRCKVQTLTIEEIKENGFNISKSPPQSLIASNDWAYNPGKNDNLYELLEKKASKKEFVEIKSELKFKQNIFLDIKKFFYVDKKEAKESKEKSSLGEVSQPIKEIFKNDNLKNMYISLYTIATHKHHKNISVYDYYILHRLLKEKPNRVKKGNRDNHYVFIYRYLNTDYKIVLKMTDKNEIFIQSVVKGSNIK